MLSSSTQCITWPPDLTITEEVNLKKTAERTTKKKKNKRKRGEAKRQKDRQTKKNKFFFSKKSQWNYNKIYTHIEKKKIYLKAETKYKRKIIMIIFFFRSNKISRAKKYAASVWLMVVELNYNQVCMYVYNICVCVCGCLWITSSGVRVQFN